MGILPQMALAVQINTLFHRNLRQSGRTYLAHKCKNELGPERYHTPYILPPDRSYCRGVTAVALTHFKLLYCL
jgi:hypothetical protein